jgi:flagellar hook-basal body complex protein FliE
MAVNSIDLTSNIGKMGSIDSIKNTFKSDGIDQFQKLFENALKETNSLQSESNRLTEEFAAGRTDNIHEVMIAGEKANIALQFVLQVRNKILDAYTEIMRMQI